MSEFNFDKLSNLEIPEKWVDNTLSASSTSKESAPAFINIRKTMTAFACFLVVCLVGFSLFTFKPDKNMLPVDTTPTQSTESSADINPTTEKENETVQKDTQTVTEATEKPNADRAELKKPTENTSTATQPDEIVSETNEPENLPTDATQESTEPQEPSLPEVIFPDNGSPEDSSDPDYSVGDCLVGISPGYLVGNGNIYCRIYNSNHEYIGDNNIFSDQHLAHFYSGFGSTYYYYYNPIKSGLVLEPDTYTYSFYNEHNVPICRAKIVISYPES
ncbi:MAG: hypothetical protein IJO20_01435 [Ruminococcus sp.]|nr:hypothetical protein [Ruminococcus sp.]